jgi:hypothetical protein
MIEILVCMKWGRRGKESTVYSHQSTAKEKSGAEKREGKLLSEYY